MAEQETNLAHQTERDKMFYRERAVELALTLQKQNRESHWSVNDLVENANVIYCFIKGNPNE